MVILTLPTGYYIAGAAAAVALTGLVGALAPRLPALGAAHASSSGRRSLAAGAAELDRGAALLGARGDRLSRQPRPARATCCR